MKANDLWRLVRKNAVLLILIPAIMGFAARYMTKDSYTSTSTLYTGLTSGTNVQLDQSFNLFTSNAGFDNLINVFQSRETSAEVSLRLLALHLMMSHPDPKYINAKSFSALRKMTPGYIHKLVIKKAGPFSGHGEILKKSTGEDMNTDAPSLSDFSSINARLFSVPFLDPEAYKQTLKNLIACRENNDTNFVSGLLTHNDPHYSIKAISSVKVQRIGNGDLIELKYSSDDPGICEQTLRLITEVGMKNYRQIKESRSDSVVKYFERKVNEAADRLMLAENQLQDFEQANKIINYDDQSREAAKTNDNLESALQSKRNKLAADYTAIQAIEQKLGNHERIQLQNHSLLEKRNQLTDINAEILVLEASGVKDSTTVNRLSTLRTKASSLNNDIRNSVNDLSDANAVNGVTPGNTLVTNWIASTQDYEATKNEITFLERKLKSSQNLYERYVPAGMTLKRIERDISLAEQEYLEVVHSLNQAKLKVQDIELSSGIRAVDEPYFPEVPDPGKRMMLVLLAGLVGFLVVLSTILLLEYFDRTLKNPLKAARILNLNPIGIFPRIPEKVNGINFPFITSRLLEMIIQEMEMYPKGKQSHNHSPTRTILFFSTLSKEGKSFLVANIARKLKSQGRKVKVISFSGEALLEQKLSMTKQDIGLYLDHLNTPLINDGKHGKRPSMELAEYLEEDEGSSSLILDVPENGKNTEEHLILQVDEGYNTLKNYTELFQRDLADKGTIADYVLIELPPVLSFPYPPELVTSADLAIMVCRSTRVWSEADQGALSTLIRHTHRNPLFLLNGVDLQVVKSSIGKLPKTRRPGKRRKRRFSKYFNKAV